jgi:hypothetical protein
MALEEEDGMSTSHVTPGMPKAWASPAMRALDEAVWRMWLATGGARDQRDNATRLKTAQWASVLVLLGAGVTLVTFQSMHSGYLALVAATAVPFAATLAWRDSKSLKVAHSE